MTTSLDFLIYFYHKLACFYISKSNDVADDVAGGLMNIRYVRLRPTMSVEEALKYLRAQTLSNIETIYYAYVLSNDQKLIGVVSLRQLLTY